MSREKDWATIAAFQDQRDRNGWEGTPAGPGDFVAVRNPGGRIWRRFRCQLVNDRLCLVEAVKGDARKLTGIGSGGVISYRYAGQKRVIQGQ